MGQLEDEVRELILEDNKSLAVFARNIGISEHTLYSALNNGLAGATLTTVVPIAKALGVDPTGIAEGRLTRVQSLPAAVLVPVYGSVGSGGPGCGGVGGASVDGAFPVPAALHERYPQAFMLRVQGNSMNRVLPDGFYALVDPCPTIDASGQLHAVAVGDASAMVRRVIVHDNGLTLAPDSYDPTYRSELFDYGEPGTLIVSVVGRVVWFCPPEDWDATRWQMPLAG